MYINANYVRPKAVAVLKNVQAHLHIFLQLKMAAVEYLRNIGHLQASQIHADPAPMRL